MQAISHIPLKETNAFSKLVIDYLQAEPSLQPFYSFPVSQEGLWQSLQARQQKPINRELLFTALESHYKNVPANPATEHSLQQLLTDHCFTITTAHQPNIATGPLYFFYKIAHCIALAKACKQWFPAYEFVPVYYMGSEDADLAELGVFTVQGKNYTWQTKQKGAVGRMTVDAALLDILEQLYGQLGVLPFGVQVQAALRQCFTIGTTIQQATFALVHTIFGAEGLVTLLPDNATLKSAFLPIAEKEIQEGFSQKLVEQTTALLGQNYKQQASGREINLFYLQGDARERIERIGEHFVVQKLGLVFTQTQLLQHLREQPQTISPNVILRGVFQETILPNIAFVGGGGELAYWLQLKAVFEASQTHFPVLVLRNSWLQITQLQQKKLAKLNASLPQLFLGKQAFTKWYMQTHTQQLFDISENIAQLEQVYTKLAEQATLVDTTLLPHVQALKTKALAKLYQVQKKMYRAEKRNHQEALNHIENLLNELFPNGQLQERVESGLYWWAVLGEQWVKLLVHQSVPLPDALCVATHP